MNKFSDCTITVLTYERPDQLRKTLDNLYAEFSSYLVKVIVIDNGSTEESRKVLKEFSEKWNSFFYYSYMENLGCSKGREVAWAKVDTEYILSIDDDIIIQKSDLKEMLGLARSNSRIGVVSPLIKDAITGHICNPILSQKKQIGFFEAAFLLRTAVIQQVGYLDSELKYAGEGLDYGIRLSKKGYSVVRVRGVYVVHYDRVRTFENTVERRKQWVWSFCRLYFKNYSYPKALLLSLKFLFSHFRAGRSLFEIKDYWDCIIMFLKGSRSGIKHKVN